MTKGSLIKEDGGMARRNIFEHSRLQIAVLVLIFISAFLVRLYHITEPLMDFHPARQYYSASISRWFYYENNPGISEQDKRIARDNCPDSIEPPLMESLAAAGYRLIGKESLWFPRTCSVTFWMIGGVFFFLTVKLVLGSSTAFLSLLYYFFLPFTILASRSFQPEPLMVMLVISGIYFMLVYFNSPSIISLVVCSLICCFAVLEKPNSAFVVMGAFAGSGFSKLGFRRFVLGYQWLLFCTIAFLPAFLFYGYQIFISGSLGYQTGTQFIASLYFDSAYWLKWLNMMSVVTGYIPFFLGIFGLLIMPKGTAKSLCLGVWAGYLLMGLVFNYAIHTHSYYQLIFLPWLGVCFSYGLQYCISEFYSRFINDKKRMLLMISIFSLLLFGAIIWKAPTLKSTSGKSNRSVVLIGKLFCGHQKIEHMLFPDKSIVATAKEIGSIVEHSRSVLFMSRHYASPLKYHGHMGGTNWPRGGEFYRRSIIKKTDVISIPEQIYEQLSKKSVPDHIVVTDFRIFDEQKNLELFLETNFKKQIQTSRYAIYTQFD